MGIICTSSASKKKLSELPQTKFYIWGRIISVEIYTSQSASCVWSNTGQFRGYLTTLPGISTANSWWWLRLFALSARTFFIIFVSRWLITHDDRNRWLFFRVQIIKSISPYVFASPEQADTDVNSSSEWASSSIGGWFAGWNSKISRGSCLR